MSLLIVQQESAMTTAGFLLDDQHEWTARGRSGLHHHHQDIRRALDLPRAIPAERLRCALPLARTAPTIGAARRIRGLSLAATDLEWTAGSGPVVGGPAEALLMAMAGRAAALEELSGPAGPSWPTA